MMDVPYRKTCEHSIPTPKEFLEIYKPIKDQKDFVEGNANLVRIINSLSNALKNGKNTCDFSIYTTSKFDLKDALKEFHKVGWKTHVTVRFNQFNVTLIP